MQVNPVLMLCHNALDMTKRAVCSVLYQDVPTKLLVVDNASSDGTWEWLQQQPEVQSVAFRPQLGVSKGWNWGLRQWFEFGGAKHVLVLNNDVRLPRWFYRNLLSYGLPFVTGVAIDSLDGVPVAPDELGRTTAPSPDFSAFLMRKAVWEAVGRFDERMVHYASDCDYHVRAHRLGVPLVKANAPYYHERSSTLRLASADGQAAIQVQAQADRAVFRSLYGCVPGEPEYMQLFAAVSSDTMITT